MPPIGTVFQIVVDGLRATISAIVVNVTPNYFNLVQCLTDGNDAGGTHHPLVTGNLVGVDTTTMQLITLDANTAANQQNQRNQWSVSSDLLVSTPAWPDLTRKSSFKFVGGSVTA